VQLTVQVESWSHVTSHPPPGQSIVQFDPLSQSKAHPPPLHR
jgi:hypothetical protein